MGWTAKMIYAADRSQSGDRLMPFFASELSHRGFVFTDTDSFDYLICVNHSPKDLMHFLKRSESKSRAILIRTEPKAVYPSQYKKRVTEKYGIVLSPGRINSDSVPFIPWPYQLNFNPQIPSLGSLNLNSSIRDLLEESDSDLARWYKRPIRIVMINANKVSPTSKSNYSLRRKYAKLLSSSGLQIYGDLWNSKLVDKIHHRVRVLLFNLRRFYFPNLKEIYGNLHWRFEGYKGTIHNKFEILKNSRFALIIENDNEIITEKLFDALLFGCVPIYVGPDLSDLGELSDLVIKFDNDLESLLDKLESDQISEIKIRINNYFHGNQFIYHWSSSRVYADIANRCANYLQGLNL